MDFADSKYPLLARGRDVGSPPCKSDTLRVIYLPTQSSIQVGFFKKNPMKRSAAVYLLCVCLAFS